ncbi:MAG TPA: hypothetical protein VMV22_09105 [Acidimicrobiales bacterium]|nr:hypothetical protein [Acidimicrobiales bacterium]
MRVHTPMQRSDDEAIGGQIVGGDAHRVKAFPRDRVCEHEGCSTRLSVYNHGSRCAAHDRLGAAMASRRRPRSPHRQAA